MKPLCSKKYNTVVKDDNETIVCIDALWKRGPLWLGAIQIMYITLNKIEVSSWQLMVHMQFLPVMVVLWPMHSKKMYGSNNPFGYLDIDLL